MYTRGKLEYLLIYMQFDERRDVDTCTMYIHVPVMLLVKGPTVFECVSVVFFTLPDMGGENETKYYHFQEIVYMGSLNRSQPCYGAYIMGYMSDSPIAPCTSLYLFLKKT